MKISKEKHEKLMHTAQEKLFTHASKEDKKTTTKTKASDPNLQSCLENKTYNLHL